MNVLPLFVIVFFAGIYYANAELQIWTVTETRHIVRSTEPENNLAVNLAGARNEWVSFQILLRSDKAIKGINISTSNLLGPGQAVLGSADVRLFRQHQLHLSAGTYRNNEFKPDWYPDPLIPFNHPVTGIKLEGARIKAVPFDLPANQTHGFWVDIYIRTNIPSGKYTGSYSVADEQGGNWNIPISLTVWNFALPQTPTLMTEFGSPRLRDYYRQLAKTGNITGPSDWAEIEAQCAQILSENRINATPSSQLLVPKMQTNGIFRIESHQVQALREFVDRYHVNALPVPHPSSAVKDPETERDKLRAWLSAFNNAAKELNRSNIVFYTYLRDEPNTLEDYRYVQKWGRAIREAKSVVKVLVVEQPWTEAGYGGADGAWGDLYGAVDIWCPLFSLHRQLDAAKRQSLGESIWTYTALCQGPPTPWWHIDFPLINYRVPAWMAWRDGMKGLLYWGGMSYWRQSDDPWTTAPYYTGNGLPQQGQKGIIYHGEGSLVYPARDVGYDGIVPTIRLKALRDAIEDYEYLVILQRLGKTADAQKVVRSLTETFFQWEKNPKEYERARAKLAELIISTMPAH